MFHTVSQKIFLHMQQPRKHQGLTRGLSRVLSRHINFMLNQGLDDIVVATFGGPHHCSPPLLVWDVSCLAV